jgi:hypothetical protein
MYDKNNEKWWTKQLGRIFRFSNFYKQIMPKILASSIYETR